MKYGIRFMAMAGPFDAPDGLLPGDWLKHHEDTANGRGHTTFTRDPKEAMQFDSPSDAFAFWQEQSKTVPLRWDYKPNRPLTAFTCSIEPIA